MELLDNNEVFISFSSRSDDSRSPIEFNETELKTGDDLFVNKIPITDTPCPAYDYVSTNKNLDRLFFFHYQRIEKSPEFLNSCLSWSNLMDKKREYLDTKDKLDEDIIKQVLSSLKTF